MIYPFLSKIIIIFSYFLKCILNINDLIRIINDTIINNELFVKIIKDIIYLIIL